MILGEAVVLPVEIERGLLVGCMDDVIAGCEIDPLPSFDHP
jgi:hypothetical protein